MGLQRQNAHRRSGHPGAVLESLTSVLAAAAYPKQRKGKRWGGGGASVTVQQASKGEQAAGTLLPIWLWSSLTLRQGCKKGPRNATVLHLSGTAPCLHTHPPNVHTQTGGETDHNKSCIPAYTEIELAHNPLGGKSSVLQHYVVLTVLNPLIPVDRTVGTTRDIHKHSDCSVKTQSVDSPPL